MNIQYIAHNYFSHNRLFEYKAEKNKVEISVNIIMVKTAILITEEPIMNKIMIEKE